ncbi:hypothetical protein CPB83DRAFT_847468 [Crepidotus variabilis]|uniref:Guanine deaminase n=1 Tax=Crepidotus variabilis TaxID=179855 RepID=A0A9P6ENL2_9AGAR|nr:hypothetical protein CPB83DRAFT_847468 [Crepidotus variabilis]
MPSSLAIFYGAVVTPVSVDNYAALPRALLCVNSSGLIEWVVDDVEPHRLQDELASKGLVDVEVVDLKDGEFLMPGFIDTHTHAPQYPNMGTGGQFQLLDWLEKVTFPMEAKFEDTSFARDVYSSVVRRVLDAGTTTCCYYGTLHLEATKILAEVINQAGQRAFVGKCNMDRNSPAYYVEPSPQVSKENTEHLINFIRSLSKPPFLSAPSHHPLVQPILTPRFAISCTDELLSSLEAVASSDPSLRIQTHISENPAEIEFTLSLFPKASSYAGIYDHFKLLRNNTILAHGVHLTNEELDLIKQRGAGISHCPTSNFNLSSGVAPVGVMLDKDIKVGLGTDVSGGFSLSILKTIQDASIAAKVRSINHREDSNIGTSPSKFANKPLPIPTLLYLATAGGASVCDLEHHVGKLEVGKNFDALLVSIREEGTELNPGIWGNGLGRPKAASLKERKALLDTQLERFLFGGDDRNIRRVYVQGKLVGGTVFSM